MTAQFSGKTVVVTGAGGGMGREIGLAFAREGAKVVAVDLQQVGVNETVQMIASAGGQGMALVCDVTDEVQVAETFAQVVQKWGKLDCLINNAGIAQSLALTHEIAPQEWRRVLDVNVTGAWLCMRQAVPMMLENGSGAIVNIASTTALSTLEAQTAYVTSKHAVAGLTKNAAVEYAARGIRVNAVCPGGVATPMFNERFEGLSEAEKDAAVNAAAGYHPMNRIGKVEEIAAAVLFLCSANASFVTGAIFPVDGGWTAK